MNTLHKFRVELKSRRLALNLKQKDLFERTGLSRQQYQHIEKSSNPTLETLLLIAEGLNYELRLIQKKNQSSALPPDDALQGDINQDPW